LHGKTNERIKDVSMSKSCRKLQNRTTQTK
jgi:hypothetical protein